MKATLPYIGIVIFLMISSIFISLFLHKEKPVSNDELKQQTKTSAVSEFPEVGEAQRKDSQNNSLPQPYQNNQQQEEIIQKNSHEEILNDMVIISGKETKPSSVMFKWKVGYEGRSKDTLVSGSQIKFMGTQEILGEIKNYLREQKFSLDLDNTASLNGANSEGFSREKMVCMTIGNSQNQNLFDADESQQEIEIIVNCGSIQ